MSTEQERRSPLDIEHLGEIEVLLKLGRVLTKAAGGSLPEQENIRKVQTLLDIGCGPGEWVLDVASHYPEKNVQGIDLLEPMIHYAREQANSQGLENASFLRMDVHQPLDFPDASFDLINARNVIGILPTATWPGLIARCQRLLRPGGILRLTEADTWAITNSAAVHRFYDLFIETFKRSGNWTPRRKKAFCVTPLLNQHLRNAGFQQVRERPFHLNFSAGEEGHQAMFQAFRVLFKQYQPVICKMQLATQEEINTLYDQVLAEMQASDFCAIAYFLTVWGQMPVTS
jgi:ubiquinone/menaquinone biosynthesis C-methylase UbiE